MTQLDLFDDSSPEWPKPFILISLAPQYYQALVVKQTKKIEYRRGKFIDQPVTAFVYATLPKSKRDAGLPSAEIGAVVRFGVPSVGIENVIKIKEQEEPHSRLMMEGWLKGFHTASAHPIEYVARFQKPVTLAEMRREFPDFQPPQRYLVLDNRWILLQFLKKRSCIEF